MGPISFVSWSIGGHQKCEIDDTALALIGAESRISTACLSIVLKTGLDQTVQPG